MCGYLQAHILALDTLLFATRPYSVFKDDGCPTVSRWGARAFGKESLGRCLSLKHGERDPTCRLGRPTVGMGLESIMTTERQVLSASGLESNGAREEVLAGIRSIRMVLPC